jgi:hypothetical protein
MKELLSGLIGPVTGIINKVVPDKDEAARLAHEISTTFVPGTLDFVDFPEHKYYVVPVSS